MSPEDKAFLKIVGAIGLMIAGVASVLMYILPLYNVWQSALGGRAELKRAEWNRQIAIKEAYAKRDAAIALAQADVERAKGVAQANKIIGNSLKDNEAYLRFLYIQNLENSKNQIIYVPTEAQLPILEANRLKK